MIRNGESRYTVGATIPNQSPELYTMSWPFLFLVVTPDELQLKFRSIWVRKFAKFTSFISRTGQSDDMIFWRSTHQEITNVRMSRQSALIKAKRGDCWIGLPFFAPNGHRIWEAIKIDVEALNTPIEYVTGNIRASRSMR